MTACDHSSLRARRSTAPAELAGYVAKAAREAAVPVSMILGPCRAREIVAARHEAMRRAYEDGFSTVEIGAAFNRDRTVVTHAFRKDRP